ncbi:MAG: PadR family transcriptional regulator [Candidatus Bathyarchaeia archaeon]
MKSQCVSDLDKRTIKSFIDILILKRLKKQPFISGYEILRYLHEEFDVPFSPGTVYHAIYLLERKGFVKGEGDELGRIYCLTDEGERMLSFAYRVKSQIQELIEEILSE